MAENALKYRLFRHSAQQSWKKTPPQCKKCLILPRILAQPLFRSLFHLNAAKVIRTKNPIKRPRPAIPGAAFETILHAEGGVQTPVCVMNLVLK
jgi:hypothetical protein